MVQGICVCRHHFLVGDRLEVLRRGEKKLLHEEARHLFDLLARFGRKRGKLWLKSGQLRRSD